MTDASPALLRLLASVAPGTAVAILADDAPHAEACTALGLRASPDGGPDSADWAIASLRGRSEDAPPALARAARVLRPGGWVWVEVDAPRGDALDAWAAAAGLASASEPAPDEARGSVHALYRHVGADTVA